MSAGGGCRTAARSALVAICLAGIALVPSTATAAPPFRGSAEPIGPHLRQRMTGVSWHRGCPVGFNRLRLLRIRHWGFDGRVHRGRLVVKLDAASEMLAVMHRLYSLHFPIRRMRLVDAYGADDHRSMDADNTSAFNCRTVAGTERWSEHAYGRAIDVNPVENPYADADGYVSPPAGAPYADRSKRAPGLIHRNGPVVAAFAKAGWEWGGSWGWPKDYQHFSATGN
ncbi:MAG TPA: M15 family metallopeptidase [Solirubrobacterales bacterium]|nr:M15 family metallopeptidase [Solirubrobacterales bacterium]